MVDLLSIFMENLPEIVIHRLEKELVVGPVEYILEIGEGHFLGGNGYFYQVGGLLVVYVVDNLCFVHFSGGHPQRKARKTEENSERDQPDNMADSTIDKTDHRKERD